MITPHRLVCKWEEQQRLQQENSSLVFTVFSVCQALPSTLLELSCFILTVTWDRGLIITPCLHARNQALRV